jgi:hypothetical protein
VGGDCRYFKTCRLLKAIVGKFKQRKKGGTGMMFPLMFNDHQANGALFEFASPVDQNFFHLLIQIERKCNAKLERKIKYVKMMLNNL